MGLPTSSTPSSLPISPFFILLSCCSLTPHFLYLYSSSSIYSHFDVVAPLSSLFYTCRSMAWSQQATTAYHNNHDGGSRRQLQETITGVCHSSSEEVVGSRWSDFICNNYRPRVGNNSKLQSVVRWRVWFQPSVVVVRGSSGSGWSE